MSQKFEQHQHQNLFGSLCEYINNLLELKKRKINPQLLKTVKKFREYELEHHDTGVEHQAEMTTGYVLLSKTIKQLCYTAIKISKKY